MRKEILLIKQFNFVFIKDTPSVSQSNVQPVTVENEMHYNLNNIIYITFQIAALKVCFEGGDPKM